MTCSFFAGKLLPNGFSILKPMIVRFPSLTNTMDDYLRQERRKRLRSVILAAVAATAILIGALWVTGCTATGQKTAHTSLVATQKGSAALYQDYMLMVLQGRIRTNSVPTVSRIYNELQVAIAATATVAEHSTNAPPSPDITRLTGQLATEITKAKGGQ